MTDTSKYLTIILLWIGGILCCFDPAWGFLEPYFASFLHQFDASITTSNTHVFYLVTQIGGTLATFAFHKISTTLGYREGLLIAYLTIATSYFMIGTTTSYWLMGFAM